MAKKQTDPQEAPAEKTATFRVYKKHPDSTVHFAGEAMQRDEDREFFDLPEGAKEAVFTNPNLIWPEEG